ncbi:hypothetical protein ACROYT_G004814 [Oculina patagonica]
MDLKQSEPCLRGYIFVPYCTEDCCQNQLQDFRVVSPSYPTSVSKCNAFLPEQSASSTDEAPHTSQFTSHTSGGYRVLFPATPRERTQRSEVSRHKFDVERLLPTFQPIQERFLQTHQRGWKIEAGCKSKRKRTIFTADQLERLEEEFNRQQYIVGTQRFYLAADLGLNETQVKIWFQNRRIKWRRQNLVHAQSSAGADSRAMKINKLE